MDKEFAIKILRKQADLLAECSRKNNETLGYLTPSLVSVLAELRAWQSIPDNKQNP